MKYAIVFITASLVFAGQDIVLNGSAAYNASVPAAAGSFRDSWCVKDWPDSPTDNQTVIDANFHQIKFVIFNSGGVITFETFTNLDVGGGAGAFNFAIPANMLVGAPIPARRYICIQLQRDDAGAIGAAKTTYVEFRDQNGTVLSSLAHTYASTASSAGNGVSFGSTLSAIGGSCTTACGPAENRSLTWYQSHTTLVPLNSKPPTTFDTSGQLYNWKFDGTLAESVGSTYALAMTSGSATYAASEFQNTFAVAQTLPHPSWAPMHPFRAGHAGQLDCTSSYSQSDTSNTATCFWNQLNALTAPSIVSWSSHTATQPTITGHVQGDYTFQLTATGTNGQQATSTLHVGSVAQDSKCIVIQANPAADALFGPMLAQGCNPWGWQEERAYTGGLLQIANNPSLQGIPTWAVPGTGTVSYPLLGIGPNGGVTGTTLTSSITSSSGTIAIADASKIPGLASLPDWILIGNAIGGGQELVRITATSAMTGAANLTVDYDGRGTSGGQWLAINAPFPAFLPAQSWTSGTTVGEFRINGSSSKFVTDSSSPLCPVGAPGPMGTPVYSTGTVTLTGSSATIAGSGTSWVGVMGSGAAGNPFYMRINATHGGGTPFVWWAQEVSTTDNTHSVWSRTLPSDVDSGPFSYVIMQGSILTLSMADANGTYNAIFDGAGCVSDTVAFGGAYYGFSSFTGSASQTSQTYSYEVNNNAARGVQSAFGPNFYCTFCGLEATAMRTGLDAFKNAAALGNDYWIRDPHLCGFFGCEGEPLLVGGGFFGAVAHLVLHPATTKLHWSDVRQWSIVGAIGSDGCNAHDTRDSSWLELGPIELALYDPNPTFQAAAKTAVQAINTRTNNCRNQGVTSYPSEVGSWANSFLWSPVGQSITLTNGSAAGTGTGIPSALCDGLGVGTLSITNGSNAVVAATGTFSSSTTSINITGTLSSAPFTGYYSFQYIDATHGNISVLWPGDTSSSAAFLTRATNLSSVATAMIALGNAGSDTTDLKYNYGCLWNGSTSITLDHSWQGTTGAMVAFVNNLAGYNQQGYMAGIHTFEMGQAAPMDGALTTTFSSNRDIQGNWVKTYAWDPATLGLYYGRVCQFCESGGTNAGSFDWQIPSTKYGTGSSSAFVQARELNQESGPGMVAWYLANQSGGNKTLGDQYYGALWCQNALTTGGAYCDSNSAGNNMGNSNMTDAYFGNFKWYGYFNGIGFSHQWPAVRAGTVDAAILRTYTRSFALGSADHIIITLTAPSGAVSTVTCSSSPCSITGLDARQGDYLAVTRYYTSGGAVLATSDQETISVQ